MQRVVIFVVLYQLCFATTYYINIFAPPGSASCSQQSPCTNLQDALNVAQAEGDVIYFEPGGFSGAENIGLTVTVNNLSFVGNTASNQSMACSSTAPVGVKLATSVKNFTMKGIQLDLCKTGIQVTSQVNLALVDCYVSNGANFLTATGGGNIYISNLKTFSSQTVASYAISVQGSLNFTMENTIISVSNTLMYVINTPLYLTNVAVTNSPVPIRTNGTTNIVMENCNFSQNVSPAFTAESSQGGVVNVPIKASLYASNCTFSTNGISFPVASPVTTAGGGAIYVATGAYLTLVDCTLDSNFVDAGFGNQADISGFGGAIATGAQAIVNLLTTKITNNAVQCSKVDYCGVPMGGGAISCGGGSVLTFQNCAVTGNTVGGLPGGAAFYCSASSSFTINNSTIQNGDGYCAGKCSGLSNCSG